MADFETRRTYEFRARPDDKPSIERTSYPEPNKEEQPPHAAGRAGAVPSQLSARAVTLGRTGWTLETSEPGHGGASLAAQGRLAAALVPALKTLKKGR
jgi:hypothetical protein